MGKTTKLILAVLLLIFVVAVVIAVVKFAGLGVMSAPQGELSAEALGEYIRGQYPSYQVEFDESAGVVTLVKELSITYEQALAHGAKIFVDELAPETYLEPVQIIAADLIDQSHYKGLVVVLLYRSSDGQDVFSVASNREVFTCWETESEN